MTTPPGGIEDLAQAPTRAASSSRNAGLVAAGIFSSRLAGLVREKAIGHLIGAGSTLDAFSAALRIPNLMQNLLGEGVLSASFIPVYARLLAQGRPAEAGRVAGAIAGLLMLVAGTLAVAGVVLAEPLAGLFAPGFTGARFELTVDLIRILTPGVAFLVLSAWCLGVLNSHRHFFLSYVAPVLWNAAMVAALVGAALAGAGELGLVTALAWGTVVGGVLQLGVQLPAVLRLTTELRLSLRVRIPEVRTVLRSFGPVVLGRGVVQLSHLVDLLLASFLATGALGYLRFSQVLYLLPVSLFGMSVAAAELPELAGGGGPQDRRSVSRRLESSLARIAFFVVPTFAVYLLLGDLVVAALFQGGQFGPVDTVVVWAVLAAYSLGLPATTGSRLLQSALYAAGNASRPAKVAAMRVVCSALIGLVLMLQLDRIAVDAAGLALAGDLPATGPVPAELRAATDDAAARLGAAGLALGTGMAAWFELVLLRRTVARELAPVRLGGGRLPRLLAAAAVAVVVGTLLRPLAGNLPSVLAAVVSLGPAGVAYLVACRLLAVPEVDDLLGLLRRRRDR